MSMRRGPKPSLRCHHCGREVAETMHTRAAYRVDFYALHTGETEPVSMPDPEDAERAITVLRLVRATNIVSCRDCYHQPAIRRQRELLFRPELAPGNTEPSTSTSDDDAHERRP